MKRLSQNKSNTDCCKNSLLFFSTLNIKLLEMEEKMIRQYEKDNNPDRPCFYDANGNVYERGFDYPEAIMTPLEYADFLRQKEIDLDDGEIETSNKNTNESEV
jgi:hypothetical protein